MGMPLAIHPRTQSHFTQELDRAGLQHAGANSLQHMSPALPFQYDLSMPSRWSIWDKSKPAGPPPMIATWVRVAIFMSIEPKGPSPAEKSQLLKCARAAWLTLSDAEDARIRE